MPTSRSLLAFVVGALLTVGCASSAAPSSADSTEDLRADASIADGSLEAEGVLLLANDRAVTVDVLTNRTKLPADAAKSLVAARTNLNGTPRWFASVRELGALSAMTPNTLSLLLTDAKAMGYVDEGDLAPPAAAIDYPEDLTVGLTADLITVEGGFDGLAPDDAAAVIRSRIPNAIAPGNEAFLRNTIAATLKTFTLAVNNAFITNAPYADWLRGLHADEITIVGTMSSVHPTALMTKKDGVTQYWVRNPTGYEPIEWAVFHYPVLMRAHLRLETDPAGTGVRIFYPACPLKILEQPTATVEEG